MKLNRVERWSMNNPMRRAHQRGPEARWIGELAAGTLAGARVLEVGCGRGVGVEILLDQLGADTVVAVDIDPAMIDRARRRLAPRPARQVTTAVGDAVALPVADRSLDAIVDFGAIHHVPAWRDALADARRALRPGGLLLFEEIHRHTLDTWVMRTFTDHPRHDRFEPDEFTDELRHLGFDVPPPRARLAGHVFVGAARSPYLRQTTENPPIESR